jgi:crossover junction endodeoxyribonuclease RusA
MPGGKSLQVSDLTEADIAAIEQAKPRVGELIELPFPPATLSGHNTGHWRAKSVIVKKHREWARLATLASGVAAPADGLIRLSVHFYPPNRRGDAINFINRMKPYFDGIADALGVNDARFRPQFDWHDPDKDARVVISIGGGQ